MLALQDLFTAVNKIWTYFNPISVQLLYDKKKFWQAMYCICMNIGFTKWFINYKNAFKCIIFFYIFFAFDQSSYNKAVVVIKITLFFIFRCPIKKIFVSAHLYIAIKCLTSAKLWRLMTFCLCWLIVDHSIMSNIFCVL